jgi:hypothetical protein
VGESLVMTSSIGKNWLLGIASTVKSILRRIGSIPNLLQLGARSYTHNQKRTVKPSNPTTLFKIALWIIVQL